MTFKRFMTKGKSGSPFTHIATALFILILLNGGGTFVVMHLFDHARQIDRQLVNSSRQLAKTVTQMLQTLEQPINATHVENLLSVQSVQAAFVTDEQGNIIAKAGFADERARALLNPGYIQNDLEYRQNDILVVSQPLQLGAQPQNQLSQVQLPAYHLSLAISTTASDQQMLQTRFYAFASIGLFAALNLLIIGWITYVLRTTGKQYAGNQMQKEFDHSYQQLKQTIETQKLAAEKAKQEALQMSETKSQFLANMSHEIRTPLNAIIGFTELLLKTRIDQRQREFLSTIKNSSSGLLQIINDILDFSKMEAGKIAFEDIPVELRDVIEDVLATLAPAAHAKSLQLISIIYPDVPNYIEVDPLRLKQILTNLVSNGIKFTHSGSVVIRVSLLQHKNKRTTVKISVVDTGIGISREKQALLFQAFTQADTSTTREFGGTGLGLVIAERLVEQMGGKIGAESYLGKGSNFWFTFDAKLVQPTSSIGTPLQNKRIALYDTHPLARLELSHLLHSWGASIHTAQKITELADLTDDETTANKIDCIVISLGFSTSALNQARTQIGEIKQKLNCPVLVLYNTIQEEEHLLDQADKTLIKPVRHRDMAKALESLLNHSEQTISSLSTAVESQHQVFHHPLHILAVDDNKANVKLLETLLQGIDAQVTTATNGKQALRCLSNNSFDLVYMDVQMPVMDGIEATRIIRHTPSSYRDIPIIAVTAHALESDRKRLLEAGMDDYLGKPITEQKLVETILKWTNNELKAASHAVAEETTPAASQTISTDQDVIDFDLGLKLAAGKRDLAKEMFDMLVNSLEQEAAAISNAHRQQDTDELLQHVHRLHGATRYCGVPALREAADNFETMIKQKKINEFDDGLNKLLEEIQRVRFWALHNEWAV